VPVKGSEQVAIIYRTRRTEMTTLINKVAKSTFVQKASKTVNQICPDGSQCDAILTYGLMVWAFALMFLALEPIM
jgi:hypothetical protein